MIQTYQFFHILARFRFTAATLARLLVSALPAKATFARMSAMSAKCAISGLMHCSNFPLFDHLVGAAKQRKRAFAVPSTGGGFGT